jgi:hypothetical protein
VDWTPVSTSDNRTVESLAFQRKSDKGIDLYSTTSYTPLRVSSQERLRSGIELEGTEEDKI